MSDSDKPNHLFDKFLDDLMTDSERQGYVENVRGNPHFESERRLQSKIDKVLNDRFSISDEVAELEAIAISKLPAKRFGIRQRLMVYGVLVSLFSLIGLTAIQFFGASTTPHFQPQSLTEIYANAASSGFLPYHECKSVGQVAGIIRYKIGSEVAVKNLQPDDCISGISYLGGFSRNCVSVFATVENQPVLVFVDDTVSKSEILEMEHPGLQVFAKHANGVSIFEVTPLSQPSLLDCFQVVAAEK
ncbi:MAG: hypothetical protein AAGA30_01665 [Planctomycetota bacterium]